MKYLTLSLITIALLANGCGGSSSSEPEESTKITTVAEAKTNFKALGGISSFGEASTTVNTNNKLQKSSSQKSGTKACDSGSLTYNISDDENSITITSDQCRLNDNTVNGSMSLNTLSNGSEEIIFKNLSMSNPNESFSATSLVMISNDTEHWMQMDGDLKITSKCFSGKYDFKTIEKLYEVQGTGDNIERGILEMNGVRYTFNNPNVTIQVGTQTETILQTELDKRMNSTATTCTQ